MESEKVKKKKNKEEFHSEIEERLVTDILKVDLKEAANELDNRIVVQHRDNFTGNDCFNAFNKKVLIRDDNGKRIVINNHNEIKKQKRKNAVENNQNIITENISSSDEVEFDD